MNFAGQLFFCINKHRNRGVSHSVVALINDEKICWTAEWDSFGTALGQLCFNQKQPISGLDHTIYSLDKWTAFL